MGADLAVIMAGVTCVICAFAAAASVAGERQAKEALRTAKQDKHALAMELGACANIFEEYARLHAAKGTSEGGEKARKNIEYARRARHVIDKTIHQG